MKTPSESSAQDPEQLLKDLRDLVSEAEKILGESTSAGTSEALGALRARFEAAQARFAEIYADAKQKVSDGAKYADEMVRENPYQSIAVAAGIGLLVGVLLGRSSNK